VAHNSIQNRLKEEVKNVDVDEEKCDLCGTPTSPGVEYCVACGEALKRKMAPSTKEVTIEMTESMYDKIDKLRGGVTVSDYIKKLVAEHLKKQKSIPPEVVDRALID
jgi:hypothetical protein